MLCYQCMREKGNEIVCPFCGSEDRPDPAAHHLPAGTVVGNRYVLGRALGEGGFGITYIGLDRTLDIRVAVKEYYPYGISHRVNTVSNTVTISSGDQREAYDKGRSRFLSEAKTVARFNNQPGIVSVTDFLEENNTAYIVMEYLDGVDLRQYLRRHGVITVEKAIALVLPVIKSLDKIHAAGIIHRDISPDNLMVLKDGSVKLMDFGAAREYVTDERSMSVMLKKGYAPEEQYRSNGKQGPWTDVYGICATIYRCITGKTPVESLDRVFEDELRRPSELGVSISAQAEEVLMRGMAVRYQDRYQSMEELYQKLTEVLQGQTQTPVSGVLTGNISSYRQSVPDPLDSHSTQAADRVYLNTNSGLPTEWNYDSPKNDGFQYVQKTQSKGRSKTPLIIIGAAVALVVILLVVLLSFKSCSNDGSSSSSSKPDPTEAAETVEPTDAPATYRGDKPYDTVQDYLDSPSISYQISATKKLSDGLGLTMDIYAEGDNMMVYQYTYETTFTDAQKSAVKSSLEQSLEENKETYLASVDELEENINAPDPKVKLVYLNGDGTEIASRVYER